MLLLRALCLQERSEAADGIGFQIKSYFKPSELWKEF